MNLFPYPIIISKQALLSVRSLITKKQATVVTFTEVGQIKHVCNEKKKKKKSKLKGQ